MAGSKVGGWEVKTENELIADLKVTFPGIHARPLSEYGAPGWTHGVWTGGEALMPDGLPVFSTLHNEMGDYDGGIHEGFTAWLASRGWYIETYDYGTHFIVPSPDGQQT